ncbi:MAG: hypothetical protein R3F45_10205 [Gammaproteobacteria bacterium]
MAVILISVRLPSELPLATELGKRLRGIGEEVILCSEEDAEPGTEAIRRTAASTGAGYANMQREEQRLPEGIERTILATGTGRGRDAPFRKITQLIDRIRIDRHLNKPRYQAFIRLLSRQLIAAGQILDKHRVSLIIVFQDGASGNAPLIRAAGIRAIPVLDCPYGFGTSRDFEDYLREKQREGGLVVLEGPLREIMLREYPRWTRRLDGEDVVMYPPDYIVARERLGMGLKLPWVVHGGNATVLAAESQAMLEHYIDEGIEPDKIRMTGTVYCDVLHEGLMRRESEARKNAETRMVLVSIPPSYHVQRPGTNEFSTYEEMCERLIGAIAATPHTSVTVSLHPGMTAEQRAVVERLGVNISSEWIMRLIPACDIYVTTFSSTIRWATVCGTPVINYNAYAYSSRDYDDIRDIYKVTSVADVRRILGELMQENVYRETAGRQRDVGQRWGMLDGRNFARTYQVIRDLCRGSGERAAGCIGATGKPVEGRVNDN